MNGKWINGDLTIYLYMLFNLPYLGGGWTPLECTGCPVAVKAYAAERWKELDKLLGSA